MICHRLKLDLPCTPQYCLSAVTAKHAPQYRLPSLQSSKVDTIYQSRDFLDLYFDSLTRNSNTELQQRWEEVENQINYKGLYHLKEIELIFGARLAWRNNSQCLVQHLWSRVQIFNAQYVNNISDMFQALCDHIRYATNGGNIRPAITVFNKAINDSLDLHLWNSELIGYAGYKDKDGILIGDPTNLEFTQVCQLLGWNGPQGDHDILPLVLSKGNQEAELYEIPRDLVLEVPILHPKFPWFETLNLHWHVLPTVCDKLLEIGGQYYTCVPINTLPVSTEITSRILAKRQHDYLKVIANYMNITVETSHSLWKDRAAVELNFAILDSFKRAGVLILDHHTASDQFVAHFEKECKIRGGCPADALHLIPYLNGGLTSIYHQEMINFHLTPSFQAKDPFWKKIKKNLKNVKSNKDSDITVQNTNLLSLNLRKRVRVTILYGSETGQSERYAKMVYTIFSNAFHVKMMSLNDFDLGLLPYESILLFITGSPAGATAPVNAEKFKMLLECLLLEINPAKDESNPHNYSSTLRKNSLCTIRCHNSLLKLIDMLPLNHVKYAVFGMAYSTQSHNQWAFAKWLDYSMKCLGLTPIVPIILGDIFHIEKKVYIKWLLNTFKACCNEYSITTQLDLSRLDDDFVHKALQWLPERFRIIPVKNENVETLSKGLAKLHGLVVQPCKVISKYNIHSLESERITNLIRLDTFSHADLDYEPGDTIGIFPANRQALVEGILLKLKKSPSPFMPIRLECLMERVNEAGNTNKWVDYAHFPLCCLHTALMWYLDITSSPSQAMLEIMSDFVNDETEKKRLIQLSQNYEKYEIWKFSKWPGILDVMEEFTSLSLEAAFLLSELPLLQPRYYAISCSHKTYPSEIHITVPVVSFTTEDGSLRHGVCSTYLNSLNEGQVVSCFIVNAPNFHLPDNSTEPIIMISPGSGLAPFRSFWQQRKFERDSMFASWRFLPKINLEKKWGYMMLICGSRTVADHLYKSEMERMKEEKILNDIHVAYSRELNSPKRYVQDILLEESESVASILTQKKGHIFVSGDMFFANDVFQMIDSILQHHAGMTKEKANSYLNKLKVENHYHEDIFGITLHVDEFFNKKILQK